ncbi:MAG: hypothetical protein FWF72_02490 [Paludibacter sp.]|nr:hypothetical protein [Paludibacter sp.]
MKHLNKIGLLSIFIMTMTFIACKDDIVREPSPQFNKESNKVYFPEQENNLTLEIDATKISVTIAREISNAPLTVGLLFSCAAENAFIAPSSVSFAAGEAETTFDITVTGNVELMKQYLFQISVEQNQTDPYTVSDVFPVIVFNVIKEDFAPYSTGEYYSGWWWESWEADMEYSPATERYRIKAFCGHDGYDAYFQWNGGSEITMVGGSKIGSRTGFQTGEIHSDYGMIYASYSAPEGPFEYDEATKTFTFGYAWRVAAGSWGVDPDTYTITALY